jgi:ParB family chromosome partitioning protein
VSKKALGRGLEALIGPESGLKNTGVQEIDVVRIHPNPDQPRKEFDSESLEELASSLQTHGLLQPILIKPHDEDYVIVAGERRYRAAQLAGLKKIPCIIQECTEQEMAERALVENIQRSNLSPVDEGMAYARLMKEYGLTQEQVSERVGKNRSTIANLLRVIQLPERVLQLIRESKVSLGHAKVLLGLKDTSLQVLLAEKVGKENLSVRELEALLVRLTDRPEPRTVVHRASSPLFSQVEDKLRSSFQTKVRLKGDTERGKIEIEFFSEEEFNRLLELWNIQVE